MPGRRRQQWRDNAVLRRVGGWGGTFDAESQIKEALCYFGDIGFVRASIRHGNMVISSPAIAALLQLTTVTTLGGS